MNRSTRRRNAIYDLIATVTSVFCLTAIAVFILAVAKLCWIIITY